MEIFIAILIIIWRLASDRGAEILAKEQVEKSKLEREQGKEQKAMAEPSRLLQIHHEMITRKQASNDEQQPTARNRRAGRISH